MISKIVQDDLNEIIGNSLPWENFYGKNILISGANGFLPAYMAEVLLQLNRVDPKRNVKVFALVRNIDKAKKRFKFYENDQHLFFIHQDVTQAVNIDEKIDIIIHAASQASPKYYGTDPVGTLTANVQGTMNLLNLAKEKKSETFLYFSSGEVYGQVDNENNPVKENYYGYLDPMNVRSCYGESKRMGENMCVSYYHQFGINTKVVRPFHTYGPGMQLDDGRVYADFVANILNEQDIEMKSDGAARRAFCYLKDATVGFFTVLLKGKSGEAYNVGNPTEEHSILELAEALTTIDFVNSKVVKLNVGATNGYLKSPLVRNTPNIHKLTELGWSPQTGIVEGFTRTIKSYSE